MSYVDEDFGDYIQEINENYRKIQKEYQRALESLY